MGISRGRALTWNEAQEASDLYAEQDERGKRKWTLDGLAARYGVGETTIYRAVNRKGPYRDLRPPKTEAEIEEELAGIAERFMRDVQGEKVVRRTAEDVLNEMSKKGATQQTGEEIKERLRAIGAKNQPEE